MPIIIYEKRVRSQGKNGGGDVLGQMFWGKCFESIYLSQFIWGKCFESNILTQIYNLHHTFYLPAQAE
jgi:hypothetical protein